MKIETGIKRVIDGVEEKIVVECYLAKYPYERIVKKVIGEPTKKGKRSPEYIKIRRELGDHWDSDISDTWFMPGTLRYEDVEKIGNILRDLV